MTFPFGNCLVPNNSCMLLFVVSTICATILYWTTDTRPTSLKLCKDKCHATRFFHTITKIHTTHLPGLNKIPLFHIQSDIHLFFDDKTDQSINYSSSCFQRRATNLSEKLTEEMGVQCCSGWRYWVKQQTIEFVSEKLTEEWVCAMVPRVNILSKTTNWKSCSKQITSLPPESSVDAIL